MAPTSEWRLQYSAISSVDITTKAVERPSVSVAEPATAQAAAWLRAGRPRRGSMMCWSSGGMADPLSDQSFR